MNRRKQSRLQPSTRIYLLAVFALTTLLGFSTTTQAQWTTNGNNINNTNSGNVGVGTTTPVDKLEVSGTSTNVVAVRVTNTDASGTYHYGQMGQLGSAGWGVTDWPNAFVIEGAANGGLVLDSYAAPLKFQAGRVTRMTIDNTTGNVGIGTSAPTTKLTITDGATPYTPAVYDLVQLKRNTSNTTANDGVAIIFGNNSGGFRIKYGGTSDRLSFLDGGSGEVMSLVNGGNVGIGTASPTTKLHVVGDVTVTGNIAAKYQDVAEWVPSRQKLSAGTVVVLDTEQSNHVMASERAYDTRVAGVVSAQPGVLLGEAGENKAMVATTGRVKVRVDATRSPIKVGDLLVTGDRSGTAMKSEPLMIQGRPFHSPGTLIGKALEPLEKGTGEILVLLSLQ